MERYCCFFLLISLLFLEHQCTNALSTRANTKTGKKTAIVVGGGPSGLASALVLAELDEFDEVTILEGSPQSSTSFDASRAYFYNINKRGQRFTDAFGIDLSKKGVGVTAFAKQVVPADPSVVFDGNDPISREMTPKEQESMGTLYWIPRHELVQLFMDRVQECQKIHVCSGMSCDRVEPTEDGRVCVIANEKKTSDSIVTKSEFYADLCVGADGLTSTVRQSLADGSFEKKVGWVNGDRKKFTMRQWTSPSTGLRIKGLRLSPNFAIPNTEGEELVSIDSNYNYDIRPNPTLGSKDSFGLFILPQKEATNGRPINICTMPNHNIWKIQDGDSMKAYFQNTFPRFDWDKVVKEEEWELFAKTQGSKFPKCQYCPHLYVSNGKSGIVLVGDALHSFPPDLGQGVNSALCDVMTLRKCFQQQRKQQTSNNTIVDDNSIPNALKLYEKINIPESRALIELARCGAPFQYNQPTPIMKFRKTLWTANVAIRLLLNKVTMGLSPKPAVIMMVGNNKLSFRQIMKRANALTFVLWISAILMGIMKVSGGKIGLLSTLL